MTDPEDAGDPTTAFELLSDETRVAVLRELWDVDGPVAFSALRERLGRPDSGRLNYHLNRLDGRFVRRTNEGYVLGQAGLEVVRAVRAGALDDRPTLDPTPTDAECPHCDGRLLISYEEYAEVRCEDCNRVLMWNEFPPAGLANRTPDEVLDAFDRWTRRRFQLAFEGICPACAGRTSGSLERREDDSVSFFASVVCGNCRYEARSPLATYVRFHPAMVARYAEQGQPVDDLSFPEALALAADHEVQAVSTDPLRVRVTVHAGDEGVALHLLVDDDLAIDIRHG